MPNTECKIQNQNYKLQNHIQNTNWMYQTDATYTTAYCSKHNNKANVIHIIFEAMAGKVKS